MVINCRDDELEEGYVHWMCAFGFPPNLPTLRTLFNEMLLGVEQGSKPGCAAARATRKYGFKGDNLRRYVSTLAAMREYRKEHPPQIFTSDQGPGDESDYAQALQDFRLPDRYLPVDMSCISFQPAGVA